MRLSCNMLARALLSGLVGACALTALHQLLRTRSPNAPRLDVLGMRALARSLRGAGLPAPTGRKLHDSALIADLASNSLLYGLVGTGDEDHALLRGAALGAAAGFGSVLLPGALGLGDQPTRQSRETEALTIGLYTAGGLAAASAYRLLSRP